MNFPPVHPVFQHEGRIIHTVAGAAAAAANEVTKERYTFLQRNHVHLPCIVDTDTGQGTRTPKSNINRFGIVVMKRFQNGPMIIPDPFFSTLFCHPLIWNFLETREFFHPSSLWWHIPRVFWNRLEINLTVVITGVVH